MPNEIPQQSGAQSRPRVLVVDDDAAIGRIVGRLLRGKYDVTTLVSGREALDRLVGGERYDAILCDLMMPEVTGIDIYERLLEVDPPSARSMLFLTGGVFTPRAVEFFQSVDNTRLEKPFDSASLFAALAVVLGKPPPT